MVFSIMHEVNCVLNGVLNIYIYIYIYIYICILKKILHCIMFRYHLYNVLL